jgi:hypothetical protein
LSISPHLLALFLASRRNSWTLARVMARGKTTAPLSPLGRLWRGSCATLS